MDKQIQAIDLIAQELSQKTIELAHYKVAYEQLYSENAELKKLEELINTNKELKELVDGIKAKEEK